jgi:hypothetical protein
MNALVSDSASDVIVLGAGFSKAISALMRVEQPSAGACLVGTYAGPNPVPCDS